MDKKEKLILVIDDEVEIRNIIKEILSDEGYNTLTAASAKEEKKILEEQSPDMVFLDIWMPEQDGISLLDEWSKKGKQDFPEIMESLNLDFDFCLFFFAETLLNFLAIFPLLKLLIFLQLAKIQPWSIPQELN